MTHTNTLAQCQEIFFKVLPESYTKVLKDDFELTAIDYLDTEHESMSYNMIRATWTGKGKFKGITRKLSVERDSFDREAKKLEGEA